MKQLEINKDYGFVFGIDAKKGQHMIYMGDNIWQAKQLGKDPMDRKCEKTSQKVLDFINTPRINMGKFFG